MKRKQQTVAEVRSLDEYRKKFFPKSYEEKAKEKELIGQGVVLSTDALEALNKLRDALAGA
jgi:hypothetical protein